MDVAEECNARFGSGNCLEPLADAKYDDAKNLISYQDEPYAACSEKYGDEYCRNVADSGGISIWLILAGIVAAGGYTVAKKKQWI